MNSSNFQEVIIFKMEKEKELNLNRDQESNLQASSNSYFPLERIDQRESKPQLFSSWSHKPGFTEACILTLLFSALAGILQGYPESLEVIIMAKGASYSDQAVLSLNRYPYMFKIFFVPFLDMYYAKRLGKSKTLILISGTVLFLLLFVFGANSEKYINNNSVWVITFLWFLIIIFVVLLHLGAEVWSLTLFRGEMKYMGGILIYSGVYIGIAIGYNLFVLFNSKQWWNQHIFKNPSWRLKREIVTHKGFIRGVSLLILTATIYCILFVKEKIIQRSRTNTLKQTLKTTKKLLTITPIMKMLVITLMFQLLVSLFNKSIELKFIQYGIDKASLVNIQSVVLPMRLTLMVLAPFYARKPMLIRQVLLFEIAAVSGSLILLLILVWRDSSTFGFSSGWMMVGFFLRDMHILSEQLLLSKVTQVIPEDIGATAYTIFAALYNGSQDIPSSIGLKIADSVSEISFIKFVFGSIVGQYVLICFLWPLAYDLDNTKIEEFGVEREIEHELRSSDLHMNHLSEEQ